MKNLKAIGFVIAATMVLSSATAITASAANSQTTDQKQNYCVNSLNKSTDNRQPDASNWYKGILGVCKTDFGMNNWYKGILDKLVTAGTITLAQETAIQTAITNAVKAGSGKLDVNTVLGGLVTAGTINANQQTAIVNAVKSAYTGKTDFGMNNRYKCILDKLVTAGTITLAQETAIQTAITNAVKSGSEKLDVNTVLGGLVTAGTITTDQQTAIVNAIKAAYIGKDNDGMNNRYKTMLDKLVTAGTITLAQETAIQTAVANAVKSGNGKLDVKAVLAGLVTAGTITADQQTAIEKVIPGAKSDNCANANGHGQMNKNHNNHQWRNANA